MAETRAEQSAGEERAGISVTDSQVSQGPESGKL